MPGCSSAREDARFDCAAADRRSSLPRAFGNLDRDLAAELFVDGEVDRAHAATADFLDHRVAARTSNSGHAPEPLQARDGGIRQRGLPAVAAGRGWVM